MVIEAFMEADTDQDIMEAASIVGAHVLTVLVHIARVLTAHARVLVQEAAGQDVLKRISMEQR